MPSDGLEVATLNRQGSAATGRSELDMVGSQVRREGWGRVRGGAAMVGEHVARGISSRRGQRWSRASKEFSDRNL